MRNNTHLMKCKIGRGGFSSERSFEIELADGSKLVGTADVRHLMNEKKEGLTDDAPQFEEMVDGFVKCRILRSDDKDRFVVEIPSADVVRVNQDSLVLQ